ncbi:MAG: YncE family protein [Candidatus Aminicenantes bacterium]|nr:YncE family protein [Candidatus Aminicenantes bacterium]
MASRRLIFLPIIALLVAGLCAGQTPALKLLKIIPLPGVAGRFDHFALDIKGNRLFVAALGNNTLEAIDLMAGDRIQSIPGLGKPTGVLFLPDLNRLFLACGDDGNVRVFDAATLRLLKTISGLEDADNMRFDAKAGLIYVGYAAGALAVIEAAKAEHIGDIKLAGHPESFQLEKNGGRIFVNVPDAQHIAVVDRGRGAVKATWPMADIQANFPMALHEAGHRLFVGCRDPARLVVFDTETGKRVADIGISGDIDDLFYDAAGRCLYASCGEGFLDVIAQKDVDRYERVERIVTAPGARTAYFSPELKEFYLAVPERKSQKAEIRVFEIK